MKFEDIVIGKEYLVFGKVATAVGSSHGFHCNDKDSHAFQYDPTAKRSGPGYISYENIQEIEEKVMVEKAIVGAVYTTKGSLCVPDGTVVRAIDDDGDYYGDGAVCEVISNVVNTSNLPDNKVWVPLNYLTPIDDFAVEPFAPFVLPIETLEDFEILKAIMHLHNKVSGSSFFNLQWTPDSEEVKAFMKEISETMEEHSKGWSKYVK